MVRRLSVFAVVLLFGCGEDGGEVGMQMVPGATPASMRDWMCWVARVVLPAPAGPSRKVELGSKPPRFFCWLPVRSCVQPLMLAPSPIEFKLSTPCSTVKIRC